MKYAFMNDEFISLYPKRSLSPQDLLCGNSSFYGIGEEKTKSSMR
jgi:hypothetical protein